MEFLFEKDDTSVQFFKVSLSSNNSGADFRNIYRPGLTQMFQFNVAESYGRIP